MRFTSQTLTVVSLFTLSWFIGVTKSDVESEDSKNITQYLNFYSSADLLDGEYEVRMRYGNVIVRETSAVSPVHISGEKKGLLLRQVASGPNFLQMIYKTDSHEGSQHQRSQLIECEIIKNWSAANAFRLQLQSQLRRSGLSIKFPTNYQNQTEAPELDEYDLFDQNFLDSKSKYDDLSGFGNGVEYFNVTMRELTEEEVEVKLYKSFDVQAQRKQCRRLHRRMKKALKVKSQVSQLPSETRTSRVRRGIRRFAMIPGTDWCGGGNMAADYTLFAGYVGAERCCRTHDQCKFFIRSMESRYNYFNYRIHTVSHCYCDEKFRSCLKMVNTGSANFVGKLFFNVIQTPCFVLKPKKTCVSKSSWWGTCLRYETTKSAIVQDAKPY